MWTVAAIGDRLFSGGSDGTARMWGVRPPASYEQAEVAARGVLSVSAPPLCPMARTLLGPLSSDASVVARVASSRPLLLGETVLTVSVSPPSAPTHRQVCCLTFMLLR